MVLAKAALEGLKKIFIPNLLYKKAGVIVSEISTQDAIQQNIFEQHDTEKLKSVSQVTDYLNARYGKKTIKLAIQGSSREWKLRQEKLSPCYTTSWDDIIEVKG